MIGIEIITGRLEASFGPRLEDFFNEHPNAEILSIKMRGIEGGKGMIAILKFNKKEAPKPQPEPIPKKTPKDIAIEKAKAAKAKEKAELEKALAKLKKEEVIEE